MVESLVESLVEFFLDVWIHLQLVKPEWSYWEETNTRSARVFLVFWKQGAPSCRGKRRVVKMKRRDLFGARIFLWEKVRKGYSVSDRMRVTGRTQTSAGENWQGRLVRFVDRPANWNVVTALEVAWCRWPAFKRHGAVVYHRFSDFSAGHGEKFRFCRIDFIHYIIYCYRIIDVSCGNYFRGLMRG